MIKSFRDKRTRRFAEGHLVKEFEAFARQARKRLRILDGAVQVEDLAGLPSNRLEALSGDRKGQFSIAINMQWRICFEWDGENAQNVEITDYH